MHDPTGLKRILRATINSFHGLRLAIRYETAFRQEVVLSVLLVTIALYWDVSLVETLLLIFTVFLLLITELLNSAIEATVDRIGPEYHELSKRAKDIASAAVALALLLMLITWVSIGFSIRI